MTLYLYLPFAAAIFSLILAIGSLLPKKRTPARWCFFTGMVALAVDSWLTGLILRTPQLSEMLDEVTLGLIVRSLVPGAWVVFSVIYSRGDYRESLMRWRITLAFLALLPFALSFVFQRRLLEVAPTATAGEDLQLRFSVIAKTTNVILLAATIWILMNLEQTFRSAVGLMRWRIKFVVLGLAVIFGARIYAGSQAILFSGYETQSSGVESSALFIGCIFLVVAYVRTGFAEIDAYPSRAVLGSSLTVVMAAGYLFIVGVLANLVRRVGGVEGFQAGAFVVLLGMSGLAVILLSDRRRQHVHDFVGRHFARAQHDSVRIWTEFSRRLANVKDQAALCAKSTRLISETFEVLSVTIWLLDEEKEQWFPGARTAPQPEETTAGIVPAIASSAVTDGVRARSSPFNLEEIREPWAEELRRLNSTVFPNGGDRWCVPLRGGERSLGAFVLADRVNGASYTTEELHLLQCIADQVTSVLLNMRLANEVAHSRELEAFRTMSAFFVHDLKNTAASLNLMLKNLPVHFDDPAFRADALRGIGNTARRIDEMIGRLTTLRQRPDFKPVEADLNELVSEALERLQRMPQLELAKDLQPLPAILADREQIQSVVTNLVLNARDSLKPGGSIRLRTEHLGGSVVLSVSDNGCGMSAAFLKDCLFRPFQSTKKMGLGIGMYQSRMIVQAHGGSIRVESETGKGSTFRVSLPVKEVK